LLLPSLRAVRTPRATAKRITAAIAGYTARLGVSKDKAYALYKQHGTCLQGMLNEGIMAPEGVEEVSAITRTFHSEAQ
jgi:hypothetical protein